MHILEALDLYQTQLQADGRSPHTQRQYARHVRLFADWLAACGHGSAIQDVDHQTVAAFLAAPEARTRPDGGVKKATSTNALRTLIRTFFRYLHAAGHVSANPARLVRLARCGSPPPRALTDAEAERLMAVLAAGDGPEAERDHALFHLMLATGIRLGSAVALDVDDLDLDAGEVRVRTTMGNRPEVVYLGSRIRHHLARYIGDRRSGALFLGIHGRRITTRQAQRRFHGWCREADIRSDASCHCLRHTLATRLYRRTGDLLLVQQALRHRSIASTVVYAAVSELQLQRALEG
jgi:site-specific recombinase XerD